MMNITMIIRSLTLTLVTTSVPALHAPLPGRKRVTMPWGGTDVA